MRKATLKGLLAHKLRLLLTAVAIILGVTFISGTFILTDTLHNTITGLLSNAYSRIDFQVRGVAQFGKDSSSATRDPISESLLATVRSVPGVKLAGGGVQGYAQFIAPDGKAIANGSSPTIGENIGSDQSDQRLSTLSIVQGGPPVTASDVVMDAATAQQYGFTVGQRVRILFDGPSRTFTIGGIAQFGSGGSLAGETFAGFNLPTAQAVLNQTGELDTISVITKPALTDRPGDGDQSASLRRLTAWGTGLTVAGAAMLALGLTKPKVQLVGLGAICLFIGVAMLAPAAARPLSGMIGSPIARLLGEPGKLGQENSMRNPRRTAQTASALMVGLALVSPISVCDSPPGDFAQRLTLTVGERVQGGGRDDGGLVDAGGEGFDHAPERAHRRRDGRPCRPGPTSRRPSAGRLPGRRPWLVCG